MPIGNGMTVLPQYQGSYYDLQRQQALAQALMQGAATPAAQPQTVGSGGSQNYQVMPKASPIAALSPLVQGLISAKLANQAGQGLNNLGQQQWQFLTGGDSSAQSQGTPDPTQAQGAPVTGAANIGALSGLSAGLGPMAPQTATQPAAPQQQSTFQPQGAMSPGGPMNPAGWSTPMAVMRYLQDPEGYWKDQATAVAPTDQIKNNNWMHVTPEQAATNYQNEATKNSTITGRWGYATPNDQGGFTPTVVPNQVPGSQLVTPDGGRTWAYVPMQGGPQALQQEYGAKAAGEAQFKPVQVFNSQTGRYEWQTAANVAGAGNGQQIPSAMPNGLPSTQNGLPNGTPMTPLQRSVMSTESSNNPAAVSPVGASGTMQTRTGTLTSPGYGVTPAQNNSPAEMQRVGVDYLEAMRGRYGNDSDALVAYNWGPQNADKWIAGGRQWNQLPPATQQYVGKVLAQTQNYQQPQGQPAAGSPYAASPSLGEQANADAQARGQVDTMNTSYKEVRQARATGQNALTMLDDMTNYAQTKNPALANKLYNVQGVFSADAQLFEKARDNLITQVSGSTGMSTDAARAIVEGAIPSYGMNAQAIQTGLGQVKAQVQMRMLKGDYLSDAYANGNATAYNQRENQFDQMMTPTAAAIVRMPPGQARNQAIAAAKNNPQDAQALRWGLSVGLLR